MVKLPQIPTAKDVIGVGIGALVFLQVGSFVASQLFKVEQLKLGPAFLIVIAGLAVYAAYGFIDRYMNNVGLSKLHFLQLAMIVAIVVAAYIYLPQLVPQIFESSVLELKNGIGLP